MAQVSLFLNNRTLPVNLTWLMIALVLFQSFSPLYAQSSLSGAVKDQQGQPVPFANVLLLHSEDSTLAEGAISNSEGRFSLEAQHGNYILRVKMLGYENVSIPLNVTSSTASSLGMFRLTESTEELDEVVVRGQKQLFEKQVDRTVVNVQNSITSAGSTVLEVLEKSPGVIVNRQNNSLMLNGKNGVLVMINGKVSRLPTEAVVQMLNGMSSANIEKIELITNPPAKYEAEGNAGIIHLVMAKSAELGASGNVGTTAGYDTGKNWGLNGSFNHRGYRTNSFFNYSVMSDESVNQWNVSRYELRDGFVQSNVSTNRRTPLRVVHNLQAGLEFVLNDRTEISWLVSGYRNTFSSPQKLRNVHVPSAGIRVETNTSIQETNRWQSATAGINLLQKLDDRQQLSVSLDYLFYYQHQPTRYDSEEQPNGELPSHELIEVVKQTPIHFEVASLEYTNQVSDALFFEAGAKGTMSQFTNDVVTERTVGGSTTIDPVFTNSARLDEMILAGYVSGRWVPDSQWSLQAGLRYEYTDTYVGNPNEETLLERTYGNYFPNLSVTRKLGDKVKLNLAYNRRITRPTYNDLAPFIFFVNPVTVMSGNLALMPAISDGLELGYQLKQWWVSLHYTEVKNAMAGFQPQIDPESGLQILSTQNLDYHRTYGIHTTFPIQLTPWWEFRNDVSLNYIQYQTKHLPNNVANDLLSLVYNGTQTFLLPADYSVEITAFYQSASQWGINHFKPLGRLNVGIRKQLKEGRGTISLVGTDLLNTYQWRGTINGPNPAVDAGFLYTFGMRGVSVTYSLPLGNKKLKAVNIRSGSESERQRVQ